MILIIKHISVEGAGTLGEYLQNSGWQIKTIELDKGDKLPASLKDIDAVIILGGPMNVYEEKKYPFLRDEDTFLRRALKEEIPILGICLGAQLLAKAARAEVTKAAEKEIGWYKVVLTKGGRRDLLFKGIDEALDVFQWHEDTFEIPDEATMLATSNTCRNQAFRIGKNAYGLQFHIEVTDEIIKDWLNEYKTEAGKMLTDYHKTKDKFKKQADSIYSNFNEHIIYRNHRRCKL